MPKEYFQLAHVSPLTALAAGAKVHLIGICGVAMGQLALTLQKQGFEISGSDKEFYEPMGGLLKLSGIKLFPAFDANNISSNVDLVIIGNAISYGNPEVLEVEKLNLKYTCFPQALYETIIAGKTSIVVAGTHGKSTTTSLLAHIFYSANKQPAFFIGGVAENFNSSLQQDLGKHSIVEGDEYDSAFFAKVPKFYFYRPNVFIINALEFDHADIYPDLATIDQVFLNAIQKLGVNDRLYYCCDDPHLFSFIQQVKDSCAAKIYSFGESPNADLQIIKRQYASCGQLIQLKYREQDINFQFNLPGIYNARNLAVATLTALNEGITVNEIATALESFKSLKRRFQILINRPDLVLIEDFAHHPTAIGHALAATKESFPDKKVIAIFEPRSNTSRRAIFFNDYLKAFAAADLVIMPNIQTRPGESQDLLLNVQDLAEALNKQGNKTLTFHDATEIGEYLRTNRPEQAAVIVMSNGGFGGLLQKLSTEFKPKNGS